jgi:hypothetical protein
MAEEAEPELSGADQFAYLERRSPTVLRAQHGRRAQLGEAAWEAAFAQGMAMSPDEAAEHALGKSDRA